MKLYFNINIENNFCKKETFKNLFCFEKLITKNKFFEFEILRYSRTLFQVGVHFNPVGTDHGGLDLQLWIFGFGIIVGIRDRRHWDDENWKWEEYENKAS
jgi:hypothetical protein